jgi:hypothetical protein
LESEQVVLSLDPPSQTVNAAKLQRHLNSNDGMVAVVTHRADGISPYIRFEVDLCVHSRKPLLVFVEDVLPDGLVPARVLQRRFSRGAFLRQVREHRHAVHVFKSYLGEDPPPRYQPEVSQRSCVIAGDEALAEPIVTALGELLAERGYRVIRSSQLVDDETGITENLRQADVALIFLDAPSRSTHYVRGLLRGASIPVIEFTAKDAPSPVRGVPSEFLPCAIRPDGQGPAEVCHVVDEQLSLVEEDFLELPDQDAVESYFRILVDIGSSRGRYSDDDQERVVKVVMGDEYTVGQAGAVGPGSHAEHMTFVQTWNQLAEVGDSAALAEDLRRLREHLRGEAKDPEHDMAIATLAEAETEANAGNGPAALERLSGLKRLGSAAKWALGAATTIGTTVAAAALKAVLGI